MRRDFQIYLGKVNQMAALSLRFAPLVRPHDVVMTLPEEN